jgi:hypothetical protein
VACHDAHTCQNRSNEPSASGRGYATLQVFRKPELGTTSLTHFSAVRRSNILRTRWKSARSADKHSCLSGIEWGKPLSARFGPVSARRRRKVAVGKEWMPSNCDPWKASIGGQESLVVRHAGHRGKSSLKESRRSEQSLHSRHRSPAAAGTCRAHKKTEG